MLRRVQDLQHEVKQPLVRYSCVVLQDKNVVLREIDDITILGHPVEIVRPLVNPLAFLLLGSMEGQAPAELRSYLEELLLEYLHTRGRDWNSVPVD